MAVKVEENINIWLSQIQTEFKAAISVDCVIFGYDDNSLKVLVLECNMPPFEGMPSLVGDLVHPDENLEEAVQRVLQQRTGIKDLYLEQVQTFSAVDRHPLGRVISTAYYSLVKVNDYNPAIMDTREKIEWVDVNEVGIMAFDHNLILEVCIERLQKVVTEKPVGFSLLPRRFTLMQLQAMYEAILGKKLDKRNFRRKLKNFKILIEHTEAQQDVAHRPAKYYSFDTQAYHKKSKNGFNFDL
jgi:8-oxo-dGTP diphosphatase